MNHRVALLSRLTPLSHGFCPIPPALLLQADEVIQQ